MSRYELMRIQEACNAYPHQDKNRSAAAQEWVELFTYPVSFNPEIVPVETAADPKGNLLSVITSNDTEQLAPQFEKLLQLNQYPEIEAKLFKRAVDKFPEAIFAVEMDLIGENRDVRWVANGLFHIDKAMDYLPDGPTETVLKDWYKLVDSNACLGFGRSVGGGYTYWKTVLMGETAAECIDTYLYLSKKLSVELLPRLILEVIAADNPEQLDLVAHFTKTGVTKMGISVDNPSDKLVRLAVDIMGNEKSPNTMGAFEGSLGAERASKVEFSVSAAGFQSKLFYQF